MQCIQNKAFSVYGCAEYEWGDTLWIAETALASEIPLIKASWVIYCRRFYKCQTTSDCPLDCVSINQLCCSHFNSNIVAAAKVKYFLNCVCSSWTWQLWATSLWKKLFDCRLAGCYHTGSGEFSNVLQFKLDRCPPIVNTPGVYHLTHTVHTSTHPGWFWKRAEAFCKPGMANVRVDMA